MLTLDMESLAFVAAMAAVLVVLHVVVAAYLYRVALSGDGLEALRDAEDAESASPAAARADAGRDTIPCPVCGAPNDPTYRFCRRCVADLSGTGRAGEVAGRLGT